MNNFSFLKTIDKDIYEIISEAEKLYRDEYFEQSIAQTRRFGENICKKILNNSQNYNQTFDAMLATLKDQATNSVQEKEFVEDLYFIKREGNNSIHASKIEKNGITALECLQRAFEVAINYAVYYKKYNSSLLKLQYDTELLVTGAKSKKKLKDKYIEEKNKICEHNTSKKKKTSKKNKTVYSKKKESKVFIFFVLLSAIISFCLTLTIFLLTLVS